MLSGRKNGGEGGQKNWACYKLWKWNKNWLSGWPAAVATARARKRAISFKLNASISIVWLREGHLGASTNLMPFRQCCQPLTSSQLALCLWVTLLHCYLASPAKRKKKEDFSLGSSTGHKPLSSIDAQFTKLINFISLSSMFKKLAAGLVRTYVKYPLLKWKINGYFITHNFQLKQWVH